MRRIGVIQAAVFSVALMVLMGSCTRVTSAKRDSGVRSISAVTENTLILVGEVRLDPPLKPGEQNVNLGLDLFGARNSALGRVFLWPSDDANAIPTEMGLNTAVNPPLNKTFFVKWPRKQYIAKMSVILDWWLETTAVDGRGVPVAQRDRKVEWLLPSPLKVAFDELDDEVVYIGTIRLERDAHYRVNKVEVIDDFAEVREEIRSRFGDDIYLRRSLAVLEANEAEPFWKEGLR